MADDEDDEEKDDPGAFDAFDPLLAPRGLDNPWVTTTDDPPRRVFLPDLDLLSDMLSIPVRAGDARRQRTGRIAKALAEAPREQGFR